MTIPATLTCNQLIAIANGIAKTPGFVPQCGQILNAILEELSQTYQIDAAQGYLSGTFSPTQAPPANSPVIQGGGPYPLPSDFLRFDKDDFWWVLQGVMYFPIAIDLNEFDQQVQMSGTATYPGYYAVDVRTNPPGIYIWPPSGGAYPYYGRYHKQASAIKDFTTQPWFPLSTYLYTRLAGEMMKLADDSRWQAFLGKGPEGAQGILNRFLSLQGDKVTRAQHITLDRRRFGNNMSRLRNTKNIYY